MKFFKKGFFKGGGAQLFFHTDAHKMCPPIHKSFVRPDNAITLVNVDHCLVHHILFADVLFNHDAVARYTV